MSDFKENPGSDITSDWLLFTSPTGNYTLKFPKDWQIMRRPNLVNLISPDETGIVSIYTIQDKNLTDEACIKVLKRDPSGYVPQTKVKIIQELNQIKEFSQEYCNTHNKIYWKNKVIRSGTMLVAINAGTPVMNIDKFSPIYNEMLKSLTVQVADPS
jgi:hypothetical protein